jgi:2-polyprenyl-3-methyl-5-hydroxy-6-metoxy-1,4-benzoquinol methylase
MHDAPQADDGVAFDTATLAYYEKVAPTYVASGTGGQSRHLRCFLELLAPSSRILDLGCGGGIDASAMLDAGFLVDAIEASAAIAASAERRINCAVNVIRFDQLEALEEYDAVWASASLIHVPRQGLSGILRRVFRALKPAGLHFASYKSGGREGRDSAGRYYNYLSARNC